eukprot:TRINITY_DN1634_c0_g1_i4.p1 TRINITY_DN1634_c0_g1~~TRINITY_DN1634_c0_g1_i4.p1  ORF type:complete len:258 (-),score=73.78 TRINITY_DN1634_c0_g1_i4:128-901(-)
MRRFLKSASLITLGGIGGYFGSKFGLIYNPFAPRDKKIFYQFDAISKEHQDFLRSNNFVEPHIFYEIHHRRKQTNTFFEKALLMDLQAFHLLDYFVTKEIYEELCGRGEQRTVEDREEMLKKAAVSCVFSVDEKVQGHMGIVHGGFTATLVDTFFGALGYALNDLKPVATANLQIRYKKPLKVNKEYMLVAEVDRIEGKNIFLKSYIRDAKGHIFCESTARFARVDWGVAMVQSLFKDIMKGKEAIPTAVKVASAPV